MRIIAIDPGINGGIAWRDTDAPNVKAVKMPDTVKGIRDLLNEARTYYGMPDFIGEKEDDPHRICTCSYPPAVCYIELVHAMPKQGVNSVWTFAEHYGVLKGILMCLNIPTVFVKPEAWQRGIGATRPSVPKGATATQKEAIKREGKHKIKSIVEAKYPSLNITLATSDALGILMYAEKEERK